MLFSLFPLSLPYLASVCFLPSQGFLQGKPSTYENTSLLWSLLQSCIGCVLAAGIRAITPLAPRQSTHEKSSHSAFIVFKMHLAAETRSSFPPLCRAGIPFPRSTFSLHAFDSPVFWKHSFGGNTALLWLVLWNPSSHEALAVLWFPARPRVECRSLETHGEVGSENTTAGYHITGWISHPSSEENAVV